MKRRTTDYAPRQMYRGPVKAWTWDNGIDLHHCKQCGCERNDQTQRVSKAVDLCDACWTEVNAKVEELMAKLGLLEAPA